jgi:hypothetical protein
MIMPSRRRSPRFGKIARGTAERLFDAMRDIGIAPVEHDGEQLEQQRDVFLGHMGPHAVSKFLRTDLPIAHRPPHGASDLGHGLRKGQRTRPRHVVQLAGMMPIRQRGDDDLGDVIGVDERFGDGAGRQGDLTGQHAVEQIAFGEILVEPACAHDGPGHAGLLQRRLRPLCPRLAAARQQYDALKPVLVRQLADFSDRVTGAFDRKIRLVGDVGHRDAGKRGRPRPGPGPVERHRRRTRHRPRRDAARP